MDFLRVASLAIVVAGHWLAIVPYVENGIAGGRMLYNVDPRFWPVTGIFQVIPLFFFVGGFANFTSYASLRAAGDEDRFWSHRLRRLLVPTLVLLGCWLGLEAVLNILEVGGPGPLRGMKLGNITPFAALWFLGVYLGLVLLAPATIRFHQRFGVWVPVGLVGSVALVDLLAFGLDHPSLLGVNIILVWLIPHQLGYFYADGRLRRLSTGWLLAIAGLALLAVLLLTSLPIYGRNLLDNGVTLIGITAPTLPFAVLCLLIVALALIARRPLTAWLARRTPWRVVNAANSIVMTVFLWHMTAYFAVVVALAGMGASLPAGPDAVWWLERPLFLLLPALVLVPLVWVFGRFERPAARRRSAAVAG